MSHLSMNRNRKSVANNIRSRIVVQVPAGVNQQQKQNFDLNANISQNISSIKDKLNMLKQYQQLCIQKQNFIVAQQTKNKIDSLQRQQKAIQKERDTLIQQQNLQTVCRQGQQQVHRFQEYWGITINDLVQQLKQIQLNFVRQQQIQMNDYTQKVISEQPLKVKYSPKVLQLRKNLANLIKARKYREADEVKNSIRQLEAHCKNVWKLKNQDRHKTVVQKLQRKQSHGLKVLKAKLEAIFNEKIKQRDQKFQILLKINRKRKIESSKSTISKLKQSVYTRSKCQSRDALGSSKSSSFNYSTKC